MMAVAEWVLEWRDPGRKQALDRHSYPRLRNTRPMNQIVPVNNPDKSISHSSPTKLRPQF